MLYHPSSLCTGRGHLKILSDRSLQIVRIQPEDHGTYICEGKIKGRPVKRELQVSVVVNGEDVEELIMFILSVARVNMSSKISLNIPFSRATDRTDSSGEIECVCRTQYQCVYSLPGQRSAHSKYFMDTVCISRDNAIIFLSRLPIILSLSLFILYLLSKSKVCRRYVKIIHLDYFLRLHFKT